MNRQPLNSSGVSEKAWCGVCRYPKSIVICNIATRYCMLAHDRENAFMCITVFIENVFLFIYVGKNVVSKIIWIIYHKHSIWWVHLSLKKISSKRHSISTRKIQRIFGKLNMLHMNCIDTVHTTSEHILHVQQHTQWHVSHELPSTKCELHSKMRIRKLDKRQNKQKWRWNKISEDFLMSSTILRQMNISESLMVFSIQI